MRLFVAVDLSDEVRSELTALINAWQVLAPGGVRWVRPEGIHITLKFIGYVPDAGLPDFLSALASVHSKSPLEMNAQGIGFFPNAKRPRVMWCGVNASLNLQQVAADVEAEVEKLGIPREPRVFTPHLTLARIDAAPQQIGRLLEATPAVAERDFGTIRTTQFHLYESILQSAGAVYRKVET
jgi:2'-5' RNA ligase